MLCLFFKILVILSNAVTKSSRCVLSQHGFSLWTTDPHLSYLWQMACDQLQWLWCAYIHETSWRSSLHIRAWRFFGVHLQALQLWLIFMLSIIQVKSSYHLYLCQVAKPSEKDPSPPPCHCDTSQLLQKWDERSTQPVFLWLLLLSKFSVRVPTISANRTFRIC